MCGVLMQRKGHLLPFFKSRRGKQRTVTKIIKRYQDQPTTTETTHSQITTYFNTHMYTLNPLSSRSCRNQSASIQPNMHKEPLYTQMDTHDQENAWDWANIKHTHTKRMSYCSKTSNIGLKHNLSKSRINCESMPVYACLLWSNLRRQGFHLARLF